MLSDTVLRALRTVHVLAAILFVGNVIVTGVWSALLFQQGKVALVHDVQAHVIAVTRTTIRHDEAFSHFSAA